MSGKYECLECKERGVKSVRYINHKEATRASRPKCYGCGSSRLELVKKTEKSEATKN